MKNPLAFLVGAQLMGRLRVLDSLILRALVVLLGGAFLLSTQAKAAADDDAYRIYVRTLVDRPHSLFKKKPIVPHGKLYAIAGIKYSNELWEDNSSPITIPVDEDQVLEHLRTAMATQGFTEAKMGAFPDIVITVFYGRGRLKNPYTDKTIEVEGSNMGSKVVTSSVEQMIREKDPGYAEKMQRANGEKLFIAVNAWEYPGFNPKPEHKLLWRATISVDDSSQDLNEINAKMFAAAAPYFDHEVPNEEVTIMSNVPEGSTQIGPLIDLGAPKTAK